MTDALVAGEGNGPLRPEPKSFGTVIGACNGAAHDWIATSLMGCDPQRIPIVAHAFDKHELPLTAFSPADIACVVNGLRCKADSLPDNLTESFALPDGWRGHCEREGTVNA